MLPIFQFNINPGDNLSLISFLNSSLKSFYIVGSVIFESISSDKSVLFSEFIE